MVFLQFYRFTPLASMQKTSYTGTIFVMCKNKRGGIAMQLNRRIIAASVAAVVVLAFIWAVSGWLTSTAITVVVPPSEAQTQTSFIQSTSTPQSPPEDSSSL